MKKAFLLIAIIAVLAGCKKHASSPKRFLLTKVIVNGQIEEEYIYDSRGQLIEEKAYSLGGNTYRSLYLYDAAGKLKEMNNVKLPGTKPSYRWVYTLDDAGHIKRMSYYSLSGADSGTLKMNIYHEFEAGNRLVQQLWTDEKDKPTAVRQIAYYTNGNMKTSEDYEIINQVASKNYATNYAPSDTTLPASFYQITAYPINYYYSELVSPYMTLYGYDNGQVNEELKVTTSDRKYNADGLLVQQTITTKKIKPPSLSPNEIRKMQYEYISF